MAKPMRCLAPIMMYDTGRLTPAGKRLLSPKANPRLPFEQLAIPVPCGKCVACRESRRREWVARLRMERFVSSVATFITLTYSCNPISLFKSHVQDFLKRLRNRSRDYGLPDSPVRYFICGEYGKKHHRPHWHGILFGVDCLADCWLPSLVAYKDGHPIYTSRLLERIWRHGFVTCDVATDANIQYCSKYIVKDDSPVSLKSQSLGRSPFVSDSRVGRRHDYRLKDLCYRSVQDGVIVLPSKSGFSSVPLGKFLDRYLERCDPSLYDSVRSARRAYVSNLPFDFRSSSERERDITYLSSVQNKKRILDNES